MGPGELRADLFGKIMRDVALVRSRSVHVVEVRFRRQSGIQGMAQFFGRRACGEAQLHRPRRGRRDGQQEIVADVAHRGDDEGGRASEFGQ